jgi:hypothetical protein
VFVVDIMSKHGKVSQRLTPDQGRDGIDINRLRAGNVVQAECFWLHQGSVANPTFFISSSASGFALKQAMVLADSVKIHESSYISYVKPYYPAPASLVIPVRGDTVVAHVQDYIGLALLVVKKSLEDQLEGSSARDFIEQEGYADEFSNARYSITKQYPSTNVFLADKKLWTKDAQVIVKAEDSRSICAQGSIVAVRDIGNLTWKFVMSLSAADEKSEDDWNCIVERQCRASIKPVTSVGRIKKRAECWTTHAPAIMAQADSPQGKILALLLGLEHESPLRTLSLDVDDGFNVIFRDVVKGLNDQQVEVARMIILPEPAVIAVQAPGGTGKTHCLSESVPILLQRDEEARLVITTNNNTALAKLVKEFVPHLANRLEPGERILVILSAMAKTTHAEAFAPFKQHLLVASIEELLEMVNKESANVKLSRGEEKMIEKYKTEMVNRPRFTEEKGLTELVVEKMGVPRVVFSTTAMIEEIDVVTERTTHLFIDEAGQSPIHQ